MPLRSTGNAPEGTPPDPLPSSAGVPRQAAEVRDYMEPPGSPGLEAACQRYVSEPDVSR